jgi:hypothetical protein
MIRISERDFRRFWSKVEKGSQTQCWLWRGGRQSSGHGRFFVVDDGRNTSVSANAFALLLHTGSRPDGAYCLHRCDNPPCVNPAHLYWGTPQQNMDDMWARDRNRRGQDRVESKLTNEQVLEIRELVAAGTTRAETARLYGIALATVNEIAWGEIWAHLGGPRTPRSRIHDRNAA